MFILRPYQQAAVDAVYQYLRTKDGNPCLVMSTASGKTPIIATICHDAVNRWNGRVLVLAHVKELLQQAADKLQAICPDIPVGVYSAGLGSRDTDKPIIVAGIQSVYKRACELDRFDLILVDECHLIHPPHRSFEYEKRPTGAGFTQYNGAAAPDCGEAARFPDGEGMSAVFFHCSCCGNKMP